MSDVIYYVGVRRWVTIRPVALVFRDQGGGTVFMQIVLVSVVAVVFLVRLTFALHGRTHKR